MDTNTIKIKHKAQFKVEEECYESCDTTEDDDEHSGYDHEGKTSAFTSLVWVDQLIELQKANGSWELTRPLVSLVSRACPMPVPDSISELVTKTTGWKGAFHDFFLASGKISGPGTVVTNQLMTSICLLLLNLLALDTHDQWLMVEAKAQAFLAMTPSVPVS
jgi:hypothetical protein